MIIATGVMGVIALIMLFVVYRKGGGEHILSVKAAGVELFSILPIMFFAFIIAATITKIVPAQVISQWIGAGSGIKGLLIGNIIGCVFASCPLSALPIAAALLRVGGSIGAAVALVSAASLWALICIPVEVGVIGWRFVLIRFASTFFMPVLAGLIANLFFAQLI